MTALTTTSPIAVIGAGTMGAGIVQVAATAGHDVYIYDTSQEAIERGLAQIEKFLARSVEKGKLEAGEKAAILGRIKKADTLQDLAPAKLVIEAIVENLDIKRKVFGELEDILAEDAILASNTSSISITEIGATLKRPENLVGMHFFNPAPLMKLVEVVHGLATDAKVAETVFDTATAWGKKAVHAKSTPGFIVNRVARPFYGEALRILQEGGADIPTIDACIKEAGGFRMGPFELMDLIGNDVNFAVSNSVYNAYFQDPRFKPSLIQQEQVAAGRLGRKSGQGYYDYREGAKKAEPHTAPSYPAPEKVTVLGENPILDPLIDLAREAGIKLTHEEDSPETGFRIGDLLVVLTNGATATEMTVLTEEPTVVFDLALDYKAASRIAIAKADQLTDTAYEAAAGFFQALGKQVSIVDDCPGLIVMRTLAMLANEGADAVHQGVATPEAVDIAMENGVNYPKGPMAWAQQVGLSHIAEVIDSLAVFYGEDRYRLSPFLRRAVIAQRDIV
ncbi:3-hydroxyacyl-CoA dehydrogenase PaaH [Luteithermobacter gelatinilyticus]|uniref:3-hydroxyacyl-CoA dehydrogenase PaaH n=1 Tax=Luteithermobacter gelatinilyticus TaxID=2582913 RepID=UPI001106A271|nr:3-hydroxyacyl-CoA dehydrogenase PaaH [Luteithermobacter gelatinilyticus]|tara:strand:+ start:5602 stop:7119 length:1518 start_codon:yes stop_codon:yes gene_type:complete